MFIYIHKNIPYFRRYLRFCRSEFSEGIAWQPYWIFLRFQLSPESQNRSMTTHLDQPPPTALRRTDVHVEPEAVR
jgi:hypothetical protein